MSETEMRNVEASLVNIKSDVEATLGVDVDVVRVDKYGIAIVGIKNIAPAVWKQCDNPKFGVNRAIANQVRVIDGRFDARIPKHAIEISFGQLFPCGCGPTRLDD